MVQCAVSHSLHLSWHFFLNLFLLSIFVTFDMCCIHVRKTKTKAVVYQGLCLLFCQILSPYPSYILTLIDKFTLFYVSVTYSHDHMFSQHSQVEFLNSHIISIRSENKIKTKNINQIMSWKICPLLQTLSVRKHIIETCECVTPPTHILKSLLLSCSPLIIIITSYRYQPSIRKYFSESEIVSRVW